jgi:hypothetical protein
MLYGADILHTFRIHPSASHHNKIFVKIVLLLGRRHSQQGTIALYTHSAYRLNAVICADL